MLNHLVHRTLRAVRSAGVLLSALSGSACVVGPDFDQPAPPAVESLVPGQLKSPGSAGGETQTFQVGRDIPGDWWRLFRSEPLNALVDRALQDNFDLKAAEAALRIAQANVEAQRGFFFPLAVGNFAAMRQKVSTDPLVPSTATGTPYYTTYTAQLTISYVPDVFGGIRRQVEALGATAEVQRFQLEAVQLTLTTNIALAAIQEAALRGQIAVTEEIIGIAKSVLDLQKKKFGFGQVGAIDVATQEAALAQVEQTLPPLEKQLAVQRDLMTALAGHLPGEGLPVQFDFETLKLPEELPVSMPSDLVRQRPDVRAAEANMHAASASIGVAIANRLPQINLMGNGGTTSSKLRDVLNFSRRFSFWTIAENTSQVLFDGFTLEQKQRAAEAGLDQADAQYRSAVIMGFQNVADALQALDYDARTLRAAVIGERAASKSLKLVQAQLRLGQVGALEVLNAQQTYHQARLAVVQAKALRYADTVALFQSLGGGWWNRSDVPAEPVAQPWWPFDIHRAATDLETSSVAASVAQ